MIEFLIPVLAFALLAAGWVGVQLLAKRAHTKNLIDNNAGCCGACENKGSCDKKASHV